MESLYALGLDRSVQLHEKQYDRLFNDIINQMLLNPELMHHVRPHFQVNPIFTSIVRKVSRLENEFPHLYHTLKAL